VNLILALLGIAGFFLSEQLFYIAGIAALLLWILRNALRSFRFYTSLENGPSPSTMLISSILTMMIIAGILYFFFKWDGVAWLGIVFGLLVPTKNKHQKTNTSIQG
jgi:hypothetical protein